MLHLATVLVTLCVELPLLSLIDSSVMGVVCFTHLWKRGLPLQTPQILLLELIRSCGLDLDCLRVAAVFGSNFLTALIGLSCQMVLQVIPPRCLTGDGFAQWNWVAKHLACASDFSPSLTSFWTSLKCCCILALTFCCVHQFLQFCSCRAKVLGVRPADCHFPGQISLEDFSKVGESVVRMLHNLFPKNIIWSG